MECPAISNESPKVEIIQPLILRSGDFAKAIAKAGRLSIQTMKVTDTL